MNKLINIVQNIRQKGFFHLLSANVLIQVVGFGSQLFVAGILAPDDMGRIKIIQTYLSILSIVAGMGFNSSVLKLCSENRTKEEQSALFRSALFFTLISTVGLYLVILLLNVFNVFSSDKLIQWLIPLGLFPIISNSLFMVFISYFQAILKIKLLSNLTIFNKIISIVAIIIMSYFGGIKGYYIAYNMSFILMLFVCVRSLRSVLTRESFKTSTISQFSIHWHYAKSSMVANLLSSLAAYIDILLLRYFITDMQQIGFYSFALTLIVALQLFPSTVQQITTPYFSSLADKKTEFIIAFKRYNTILYGVVGFTLVAAWLLGPIIIHWFFSGKYDASMPYFMVLALGWSIRQLTQLQSGAIFGLGKIQYSVYTSIISLTFNAIAYSVALHFYGLIGAAYASILCGAVILFTSRYFFNKAQKEIL
jgi:O-antigen/teichoic acid export membrane protein